jgi:hypothetical protein
MRPHRLLLHGLVLSAALLLGAGCSSKDKHPTAPGDASTTIEEANQLLEDLLFAQINSADPQRPSDVDFGPALAKYQEALGIEPGNTTAHFGVAVLGMLSITQDPELNAAFDAWKAYLESRQVPFQSSVGPVRTLGVPLALREGTEGLRLPFGLAARSVTALARPEAVVPDPQIGQAQDVLREHALPRLREAISHLDRVASAPAYVFTVTPRMQGDAAEPPIEIDHTDFLALRAACHLLAALCEMATAYDLNFAAYDSASLVTNFSPGSAWLALRADGTLLLRDAQNQLDEAALDVDATIVSLLAETDDQSDDVIKIGPDPAERARLEALRGDLTTFRDVLAGPHVFTDDWDGDSATPDVPLTLDVSRYFLDPVPDWKALLPAYTASTERVPWTVQYHYANGIDSVQVDLPADTYVGASCYLSVYLTAGGPDTVRYSYGDPLVVPALRTLAEALLAEVGGEPGWTGVASVNVSLNGTILAGPRWATVYWSTGWETSTSSILVPVITWTAPTFDQWTWPDPSMHGILPDIGSTPELLQTFGIVSTQWRQRNVLDWRRLPPYGF